MGCVKYLHNKFEKEDFRVKFLLYVYLANIYFNSRYNNY